MKKFCFLIVMLSVLTVSAQEPVVLNGFWDNWYAQFGLDMSLQKPYGYDFSKVFPNGKTFGIDGALGKWYTPALGLKAKLNWENGIGLFRNNHANWLAPFDHPGVNMDKGGYLYAAGEVQLDLHNLLSEYDPQRLWNAQAFIRAGFLYNFGVTKGSPLLGAGIGSTFRIDDRWSAYVDGAINLVSSGHTGKPTGLGTGANAFFDFSAGIQYNIGKHTWRKNVALSEGEVKTKGFWEDWFVEGALDMTLQCPYGKDFSQVFPKGKSFGLNAGVGKRFSPEIALRFHLNWENGLPLFKNGHLEWLSSNDEGKSNMDCGGYLMATLDVPVSVTNIVMGYDEDRLWDGYVFARAGLLRNFAISSTNPVVGGGFGGSYAVKPQLGVFTELSMQATTSDFYHGIASTGMKVSKSFNCFFRAEAGVRYEF